MNNKKFLVIGLLSLFMISMIAGVVGANAFTDFMSDIGKDGKFLPNVFGSTPESQTGIAKILLITLVVLLVYSVADSLPFLGGVEKEGVRWAFSIIVGILSFMFVTTDIIRAILTNYEALGVALTSIIPLIILMVFVARLRTTHAAIANVVDKPLFLIFGIYLFVRWVSLAGEGNGYAWIYIITAGISVIWALGAGRWLSKKFKEEKQTSMVQESKRRAGGAARMIKTLSDIEEETGAPTSSGKRDRFGNIIPS